MKNHFTLPRSIRSTLNLSAIATLFGACVFAQQVDGKEGREFEKRILVLVNNGHLVSQQHDKLAVELNTSPERFLEQIKPTSGGPSPVYGSEAIGVVKLALKEDSIGFEFERKNWQSLEGGNAKLKFCKYGCYNR